MDKKGEDILEEEKQINVLTWTWLFFCRNTRAVVEKGVSIFDFNESYHYLCVYECVS